MRAGARVIEGKLLSWLAQKLGNCYLLSQGKRLRLLEDAGQPISISSAEVPAEALESRRKLWQVPHRFFSDSIALRPPIALTDVVLVWDNLKLTADLTRKQSGAKKSAS
jgi:hypothetical protein